MERVLTKVKHRAELQAASEEDQPRLRALQEVSNVQDPRRVDNKSAKQRKCGYCKQVGSGHNKASCPQRAKDMAAAEAASAATSTRCRRRGARSWSRSLTGLGGWGLVIGTRQPAAESRGGRADEGMRVRKPATVKTY